MPANVVHVKTGLMLNDLQTVGGFDYKVTNEYTYFINHFLECGHVVWYWIYCINPYIVKEEFVRKI